MGKLSLQEIPIAFQTPRLRKELEEIILHDKHAAFHTESSDVVNRIPYLAKFQEFVKNIIDAKKMEVFNHLMKFPLETVDFTEGVLGELRKALTAQDKHISYVTTQKELGIDYEQYLKGKKHEQFWDEEAFTAMKSKINSVVVVDLPSLPIVNGQIVQDTKYASPYCYLLDPCEIVDGKVAKDGQFEWIVFKDKNVQDKYFVFDEEFFRTFIWKDSKIENMLEVKHELGYTPAHTFWNTPFNSNSELQRRGPVTNSLGRLDWLLFTYISSKHLGLYAGFPIYIMFEQRCTYIDADNNPCDNGIIKYTFRNGVGGIAENKEKQCPICKDKKILGAGTVLTAPAMSDKDDANLLDGVKVVGAETTSLEWIEGNIDKQELKLTWNMVGVAKEVNEEAKNEMQVSSGFESRVNVVMWVARNFEATHKWTLETMGKLRYGKEFQAANVSYGSKFFLYDVNDLLTEFDTSKKSGMPNFELSSQVDQILVTKYRNNPEMLERSRLLKDIEPYINYSMGELNGMETDPRLIRLKTNFDSYVSRFEREFTNIANFMPFADFGTKVDFITEKLLTYVDEEIAAAPKIEEPAAPGVPVVKKTF